MVHGSEKDFFNHQAQVLAFVCDCTSTRIVGFARRIRQYFPFIDILANREQKPGTIELWGSSKKKQRYVLGLYAQPSRYENYSEEERLRWFRTCLLQISIRLPNLQSIAFPKRPQTSLCLMKCCPYDKAIQDWAKTVPHASVEIVRILPNQERFDSDSDSSVECVEKDTHPDTNDTDDAELEHPDTEKDTNDTDDAEQGDVHDTYVDSASYKALEPEIFQWLQKKTNNWMHSTNEEHRSVLAHSLGIELQSERPDLWSQINHFVPVEDDIFSILEHEMQIP